MNRHAGILTLDSKRTNKKTNSTTPFAFCVIQFGESVQLTRRDFFFTGAFKIRVRLFNSCCRYDRNSRSKVLAAVVNWCEFLGGVCVVCVLRIYLDRFFLPVDIQHNQCPCRFFYPSLCGHKTTKQRGKCKITRGS